MKKFAHTHSTIATHREISLSHSRKEQKKNNSGSTQAISKWNELSRTHATSFANLLISICQFARKFHSTSGRRGCVRMNTFQHTHIETLKEEGEKTTTMRYKTCRKGCKTKVLTSFEWWYVIRRRVRKLIVDCDFHAYWRFLRGWWLWFFLNFSFNLNLDFKRLATLK